MKSDVLKELTWRGLISNITSTNKLQQLIEQGSGIYIGFDPSADSLHLGNYLLIRVLKIFQKYNIKTCAIVGGATGIIGDPSGKNKERNLLDLSVVEKNLLAIKKQLKKYANPDLIINNYDFYKNMHILEFLRDVGKNFNINHLLTKDIVKNRLESGISFTEFSYSLLQAYDWVQLYKNYNIKIQAGGSDQWGNIVNGTEAIKKFYGEDATVAGLTINLLVKSDGTKFGKSEKGALFLDKKKTSVYDMYQFLINVDDSELKKLFYFLTDLDEHEIASILKQHEANLKQRIGQKKLAQIIITDIHSFEEFNEAETMAQLFFEQKYELLSQVEFENIIKNYQIYYLNSSSNSKWVDLFIENNIFKSKGEIRKLITNNGLTINLKKLDSLDQKYNNFKPLYKKYFIVRKGKKNFFVFAIN